MALVLPAAPRPRRRDPSPTGILATVAIAIGAAIALCCLALGAAWAGATGSGEAIAGVVIAIGVLLVIAAFRGGARWLIVPALALALPLSAVAAADVSFDGGVGERIYEPLSAEAIPDDGYELGRRAPGGRPARARLARGHGRRA